MPAKITDRSTTFREIDRWDGGFGWIAHENETMERASHAVRSGGRVWIIDPVRADGVHDRIESFGPVGGVVILSNFHTRDSVDFAEYYGVPIYAPAELDGIASRFGGSVMPLEETAMVGEFEVIEVTAGSSGGVAYYEFALFDGDTLIVGDILGTASYYRVGSERIGVHLFKRLSPPTNELMPLEPNRVLTGHGPGIHRNATNALEDALLCSRRRFPRALAENGLSQIRSALAAWRT